MSRARATHGDWAEHGASYGWCAFKKEPIYGYKLHLLVTAVVMEISDEWETGKAYLTWER